MHRTRERSGRRAPRWSVLSLLVVILLSFVSLSEELGGVRITLQSTQYYGWWDFTVLTYRVKQTSNPGGTTVMHWVLGMGDCVGMDDVSWFGTAFVWTEEPFRGLRYDVVSRNQSVYVILNGRWEVAATPVAVVRIDDGWAGNDEVVYVGSVDGPACGGASIALDVTSGSHVAFPTIEGEGTYTSEEATALRVTASSSGWALGHASEFSIPPGASQETVARVFRVGYDPYESAAGTTDVEVGYALEIADDDFIGLPEGVYTITVTFTVTTD